MFALSFRMSVSQAAVSLESHMRRDGLRASVGTRYIPSQGVNLLVVDLEGPGQIPTEFEGYGVVRAGW